MPMQWVSKEELDAGFKVWDCCHRKDNYMQTWDRILIYSFAFQPKDPPTLILSLDHSIIGPFEHSGQTNSICRARLLPIDGSKLTKPCSALCTVSHPLNKYSFGEPNPLLVHWFALDNLSRLSTCSYMKNLLFAYYGNSVTCWSSVDRTPLLCA